LGIIYIVLSFSQTVQGLCFRQLHCYTLGHQSVTYYIIIFCSYFVVLHWDCSKSGDRSYIHDWICRNVLL